MAIMQYLRTVMPEEILGEMVLTLEEGVALRVSYLGAVITVSVSIICVTWLDCGCTWPFVQYKRQEGERWVCTKWKGRWNLFSPPRYRKMCDAMTLTKDMLKHHEELIKFI